MMKQKMILNLFPLMMAFLVLFSCQKEYESVLDPTSKTVMTSDAKDVEELAIPCIIPTNCFAPCPKVYNPVCGCDDVTYLNPCEAGCAGVQSYTPGPCCKGKPKPNCYCPADVYAPVCGCDGVTYNNACEAECAGVQSYTSGPCCKGKPQTNCNCPKIYAPVCGCDGITYSNACEARCAGVQLFTQGPCCKAEPKPNCYCPAVYDPVCGCDGVTYSNACEATCAGVSYTQGACGGGITQ